MHLGRIVRREHKVHIFGTRKSFVMVVPEKSLRSGFGCVANVMTVHPTVAKIFPSNP